MQIWATWIVVFEFSLAAILTTSRMRNSLDILYQCLWFFRILRKSFEYSFSVPICNERISGQSECFQITFRKNFSRKTFPSQLIFMRWREFLRGTVQLLIKKVVSKNNSIHFLTHVSWAKKLFVVETQRFQNYELAQIQRLKNSFFFDLKQSWSGGMT